MRITTDVDLQGPIFSRTRCEAATTRMARESEDNIAADLFGAWSANLKQSIRHPTPYYQTKIVNERAKGGRVVHDSGVIYGPWLEGTGSRNRTTRFKGYFSFRRAVQAGRAKAHSIAQRAVQRRIGELGG